MNLPEFKALSEPAQRMYDRYVGYSDEHKVINTPLVDSPVFQELIDNHFIVYIDNRYIIIDNPYIYKYIIYVLSLLVSSNNKDISFLSNRESFLFERKEKEKKGFSSTFVPPTEVEVAEYLKEHDLKVNPTKFIDYYASVGWIVGKGKKMKDWRAACRNWSAREKEFPSEKPKSQNKSFDAEEFFKASLLKGNFNE